MEHIVSFSGGKDSSAMLLRMIELKMPIDKIVFADTRKEYPEMYDYIKKVEKHIKRKIVFVYGDTWEKWFYGKYTKGKLKGKRRGFPLTVFMSWCTRELKQYPLKTIRTKDSIIYVGIATDEKHRIQKDKQLKYPLIDWNWTEQDCLDYLKKRNIINPLYKKFKRTGCWCCPKQSISALRVLYKDYPHLWKELKKMEKSSPIKFKPNYSVKDLEIKFKKEVKADE